MPSESHHPTPTRADWSNRHADELAGADDSALSAAASEHVQQCLRCQAEVANYRRMRRALRTLADQEPAPEAPELEHRILVALDELDGRSSPRVPAVAAATIGGLAAAAGVIAIAARRRSGLRLAG